MNTDSRATRRVRENATRENDGPSFRQLIEADTERSRATADAEQTPTTPNIPAEETRLSESGSTHIDTAADHDTVADQPQGESVVALVEVSVLSELSPIPLIAGLGQTTVSQDGAVETVLPADLSEPELQGRLVELDTFLIDEVSADVQFPLSPTGVEPDSLLSVSLPNLTDSTQDGLAFLRSLATGGPDALPVNGIPVNGIPVNGIPVNGIPVNGIPVNGIPVDGIPVDGIPEAPFSETETLDALRTSTLEQEPLASEQAPAAADPAAKSASDVLHQGPVSAADAEQPLNLSSSLAAAATTKGQAGESGVRATESGAAAAKGSATESSLLPLETETDSSGTDSRSAGTLRSSSAIATAGSAPVILPPSGKGVVGSGNGGFAEQIESVSLEEADASASRLGASEFAAVGLQSGTRNAAVESVTAFASKITEQIAGTIITHAVTTEIGDTVTLDAILDPPDLGRLHFRLTRSETGLRVVVAAENGDVQHAISQQAASIEQAVRAHLKTDESMQFLTSDTPFGDGTPTPQEREQPQRPTVVDDRSRGVAETDEAPRTRKTSQAEVDVLA